jgi:hydroxypyruvate isomerase
MERRTFLKSCSALALGSLLPLGSLPLAGSQPKFSLKYGPNPNSFKNKGGKDIIDQIKFAADQGFTGWEFNGLPKETPEMQSKIGAELAKQGMTMGVFVAYAEFDQPSFARKDKATWDNIAKTITDSVDVAKRVGATWMTVVPGSIDQQHKDDPKWNRFGGPRLPEGMQFANVVELLRRLSGILEPHKLVMVLEPLNSRTNHGGAFINTVDKGYAVCKAVNSPSCKILFDMYHEQIDSGNIINSIDTYWDEVVYMQCADNPGRKEPGTGEMNYRNIFHHIYKKGYQGVIGMEHGNSIAGEAGEQALIDAYRAADSFPR